MLLALFLWRMLTNMAGKERSKAGGPTGLCICSPLPSAQNRDPQRAVPHAPRRLLEQRARSQCPYYLPALRREKLTSNGQDPYNLILDEAPKTFKRFYLLIILYCVCINSFALWVEGKPLNGQMNSLQME